MFSYIGWTLFCTIQFSGRRLATIECRDGITSVTTKSKILCYCAAFCCVSTLWWCCPLIYCHGNKSGKSNIHEVLLPLQVTSENLEYWCRLSVKLRYEMYMKRLYILFLMMRAIFKKCGTIRKLNWPI